MEIVNFGGNVRFTPAQVYIPESEQDVLDILNRHRNGHIRVVASLHAWSNAVVSDDVIIDMRNFDRVEVGKDAGRVWANVGAGCVLKRLLDELHRRSGSTLPTLGGIRKQTIAGAISTATHGSGSSSLSHFVEEVRVAAYDPVSRRARVYHFKNGARLRAARCALGCMGVILSVKLRCVPKYWLKERIGRYKSLQEVLALQRLFPLQQFTLFPYLWEYFAYQRSVHDKKPSVRARLVAWLVRIVDYVNVEILPHATLKFLIYAFCMEKGSSRIIPFFYRRIAPLFMHQPEVINDAETGLTLHTAHHYTFRHLEIEVFIPQSFIHQATEVITYVTSVFAGASPHVPGNAASELQKIGADRELEGCRGSYMHHYPFFFRYVLPDDTLISATSGREAYYAIGFFTYLAPEKRQAFYQYAQFMARILARLYGARLHWGKYFPLRHSEIARLYPRLSQFRKVCRRLDPHGTFQNAYTLEVLGF